MKRDEFIKKARPILNKSLFNRDQCTAIADYCATAFDLPRGYTMDLVANRTSLADEKDQILFYIADALDHVLHTSYVEEYFKKTEKEKYIDSKYAENGIDYPIIISCIETNQGRQWIGSIDVQWLMRLRKANKIRYNADKQRVRQRLLKGEEPIFKNTVKERSVREIAKLMKDGNYIPDDITLDIPDDCECDFQYYDQSKEMVINKLDTFDITDGYHRYLAMCRCYDEDPSFNYPMELRITKFSVVRTQQFIYQKDQKNKMSITNSKSMNTFRPSNDVINRMNERGSGFELPGMIQRNGGSIEYAGLSDIIEYYWFKGKRNISNRDIAEVKIEVQSILNQFLISHLDYFDTDGDKKARYLDFRKLIVLFWLVKDKGESPEKAGDMLEKIVKNGEINKVKLRTFGIRLFNQLETIIF